MRVRQMRKAKSRMTLLIPTNGTTHRVSLAPKALSKNSRPMESSKKAGTANEERYLRMLLAPFVMRCLAHGDVSQISLRCSKAPTEYHPFTTSRTCPHIENSRWRAAVKVGLTVRERPRGVMRGPGVFLVAAVRAVYCGIVKKLDLNCHGRNASASVGTVTVNGC